ncbi:MAG: NAD-dependent epimerase/dehydratase family protein [Planctomycetia bacterium]|nr:NAD-dependent epimerase/dehydratase family protein [Planctomycetia bacterium]
MRALITGGGGFLGQYIVEQLLQRGEKVRVFSRKKYPELEKAGAESFQGDLRSYDQIEAACSGMDVIFHTAALPGISVWRKPYYETNVLGTQNVVAAALRCGIKKLICTSSPSVADGGKPQCGVDESVPYPKKFLAWYPETKAIAEKFVLEKNGARWTDLNDQGKAQSGQLWTCALRPRLIWGPRDHHLIPRLLDRARSGRLMQVGDGKNKLDMIYVENAAKAHLLACDALEKDSPVAGKAYYLSQGEPVLCWNWINEILKQQGLPPVKRKISFRFAYILGSVFEFLYKITFRTSEPPMSRFLATQLAQSYWFDISNAKNDFGYEPEISTEEGMKRLNEYLHENHGK